MVDTLSAYEACLKDLQLVIFLMITNTPPLEQGKQKYIFVIFTFFKYSMSVTYLSVLSDQNKL